MKKKIALFSDTFLWHKGMSGLMYNAETGNHMIFSIANPAIALFCDKMDNLQNLYTIEIDDTQSDVEYAQFLSKICTQKLGAIIPSGKPYVSLPPKPFVIHNAEKIQESGDKYNPYPALNNLSTLIIYLGGETRETEWFRQATYPVNTPDSMHFSSFSRLIDQGRGLWWVEYKIVVSGQIDNQIIDRVRDFDNPERISFVFSPESLFLNKRNLHSIMENRCHVALVLAPEDIDQYVGGDMHNLLCRGFDEVTFLLDSEDAMRKADVLEQYFLPHPCSFVPVWNNNLDFLTEHIFFSKEELLNTPQTKRQIHLHQLVNLNYWGQMVVMPDGAVFSDVNAEPLGYLSEGLPELALKELILNKSWRRVREYGICSNCVFQWLCPSPSVLERLSGHLACQSN